ncbi:MAG: molybdopterin dinucleotide binding domain-containing protein, partial [Candidatus Fermentibacteria bacterium]|nr:molybdopterin dinucleotide binding domain-containing protein [Candidatus Fermentibacteria bacterium]
QLCEKGWLMPGTEYEKHENRGGFNTATGKIELQPLLMKKSDLLPAPWSISPPSSSPGRKDYPLKLTSGARSPLFFHGEHKNIQLLRELEPYPTVEVHPDDMPSSVGSGSWVAIETPWGKCQRVLIESVFMKRGVISAVHGWTGPGLNVNDLLTSGMQGRGGLGYPFRCLPCRITGPVEAPAGFADIPERGNCDTVVEDVQTIWCTGCRACAVACTAHTGVHGLVIRLIDGEWTPGFTSACLECTDPVCEAVCHTKCLVRGMNGP